MLQKSLSLIQNMDKDNKEKRSTEEETSNKLNFCADSETPMHHEVSLIVYLIKSMDKCRIQIVLNLYDTDD